MIQIFTDLKSNLDNIRREVERLNEEIEKVRQSNDELMALTEREIK